jgi:ribonuclease HI
VVFVWQEEVYQIEYDGASKRNPGPAGAGALVRAPNGSVVCELREGLGVTTNNVAEYRALILGLCGALERGIYRVRVQGDSNLVCQQVPTLVFFYLFFSTVFLLSRVKDFTVFVSVYLP